MAAVMKPRDPWADVAVEAAPPPNADPWAAVAVETPQPQADPWAAVAVESPSPSAAPAPLSYDERLRRAGLTPQHEATLYETLFGTGQESQNFRTGIFPSLGETLMPSSGESSIVDFLDPEKFKFETAANVMKKAGAYQERSALSDVRDANLRADIVGAIAEAGAQARAAGQQPTIELLAKHPGVIRAAALANMDPLHAASQTIGYASLTPEQVEQERSAQHARIGERQFDRMKAQESREGYKDLGQVFAPVTQEGSLKSILGGVRSSVPDLALAAGGTAVAGPVVGLGLMGASVFPEAWAEAREMGADENTADLYALLRTGAEVAPELPVIDVIAKTPAGKQLIKKMVGDATLKSGMKAAMSGEAISEGVTQSLQIAIDAGVLDKETSFADAVKQVGTAMTIGAGAGGAVHAAIPERAEAQPPAAPITAPTQVKQPETPAAPAATMPPPVDAGSPPPASAPATALAPIVSAAQGSASTPPQAPPPVAQQPAAAPAQPAPAPAPAQAAPPQPAPVAAPAQAAPAAAQPQTEVPPAAPSPISTPVPAPQAVPVQEQPEVKAGGTTAPEPFEARLQRNSGELRNMAQNAGWSEIGGKVIMTPRPASEGEGMKATGRTTWLPNAPWFKEVQGGTGTKGAKTPRAQQTGLPKNNDGNATREAVRKALAGEKLTLPEQRHINAMLDYADRERAAAAQEGLPDADPWASGEAVARAERPEDQGASPLDAALTMKAAELDPDAFERAAVQFENDDTGFSAALRAIIAAHGQSSTHGPSGQAVRPTDEGAVRGGRRPSPDSRPAEGFALTAQERADAKEVAKPAPSQPDMFGRNETKQALADREREKDRKRSPGTDVPADIDGGLFSNQNKQADIADVEPAETQELADDVGEQAAIDEMEDEEFDEGADAGGGVEASFSQEAVEASSRGTRADEKMRPSTARENLMNFLGIDPTSLRLKGGQEQFNIVSKAIMDRYGFKYVKKHPSQNWRNATDHLLDGFESLQNMAAALGISPSQVSLNGKIGLELQRNTKALGVFKYPGFQISIFDQADVYSHELGHAIDYDLMEQAGAMEPGGLSRMIRNRENATALPKSVLEAYADLMTALYFDAAHIAQEIKTAEHQIETTKSDKQRAAMQKRLDNLRSGAWRGRGGKTQFYQRAKKGPMADYMSKPTELVARSHEAYISQKIQSQKELGLVTFLGKTDAIYTDKADAWIERAYPQDADRAQIFAAWDNLYGALAHEGITDTSKPVGFADSELNLGLMDPVAQAKAAGLPITPDIVKDKNLTHDAAKTYIKDETRRRDTIARNLDTFNKAVKAGAGDALASLNALMKTLGGTPDGVFAYLETKYPKLRSLRTIRDNLSDAQIHGRNKPVGIYREIARQESQLVNQVTERLQAVGILPNMDQDWVDHMWDVMHGYAEPKNATEKRQADQMRYEYDRLFKLRDKHGVGLGYTSEPYMNRITHPMVADDPKFQAALVELRKQEKEALLEKLNEQLEAAESEEAEAPIKAKIKKAEAINPEGDTAAHIAAMKGMKWGGMVTLGAANEDSAKERVFGPLADKILKDFYIKDPVELLSTYAGSAAREMVMKRRLGDNPTEVIQSWLNAAALELPKSYADLLMHSMQASLGIQTMGPSIAGSQVLHAYSALSNAQMLGRASLPNMSEPFGVLAKSLTPARALAELTRAAIPLLRSQTRKARYASADQFGRISGILVDAAHAMTAQAQITGDDTQGKGLIGRFSQKAYYFNLMTPLTSAQEKVINRLGLELFYDAAASIRANDKNAAMYSQWLREHGIKDASAFAEFLKGPEVLDKLTVEDTFGGQGLALANAMAHFVHTTIQKPTPSTKMLLSNRGNFGLIFRLTSWMTTNFRNWAVQNKDKMMSAFTGKYGDAHLTAVQRTTAMAAPVFSTLLTMYVAQSFFVVARMMLTHADEWEDRGDNFWERFTNSKTQMQILQYWGLLGWLANTVIDVTQGARFNRGLFATLAGPVYGPLVQDAERFIALASKNSKKTNTAERNAAQASYHFLSMLVTLGLVSILPQSKLAGQLTGFAWSFFGTSPQAAQEFADVTAGEKAAKPDKNDPVEQMKAAKREAQKERRELHELRATP